MSSNTPLVKQNDKMTTLIESCIITQKMQLLVDGVVVRIPPIKQEVEGSNPISANPREVR